MCVCVCERENMCVCVCMCDYMHVYVYMHARKHACLQYNINSQELNDTTVNILLKTILMLLSYMKLEWNCRELNGNECLSPYSRLFHNNNYETVRNWTANLTEDNLIKLKVSGIERQRVSHKHLTEDYFITIRNSRKLNGTQALFADR